MGRDRGRIRTGRRMCGRQGQWPEGIRTGRGIACVGRRPEGVTTGGTGFGPGGTSYVRAVGGGQQPERRVRPMMRFAVRVGGMRCGDHTHAQLPGMRTDGGARRLEPADKAEWVRRGAACRGGTAPGIRGPRSGRCAPNRVGNGCRGLVPGIGSWETPAPPRHGSGGRGGT